MRVATALHWPAEAIESLVAPMLPHFTVEVLPEIDSTNSELMRRARAGDTAPTLLVAEKQTAGRGRLGRTWHDLSDRNDAIPTLTFSLGLPLSPMDWSGLSLAVGTSLAQSLHPKIGLKWPNDLWFEDRKLAGILIETCSIGQIRYAVVGVGINILSAEPNSSAHAPQLRRSPAWLQELLTTMNAPDALLRIVPDLVQTLQVFERQGFAPFQASFHQRDVLLNLDIAVDNIAVETQPLSGTARGVNNKGELQLESAQGLHLINCSEVSVKPL